jgi:hypothetical protein
MRTLLALSLAAATFGLGAASALADVLPTAAYYFSCAGGTPYQGDHDATWDKAKPAASFQTGAGCGFLDTGPGPGTEANGNRVDFIGGGTHDGTIQSVTVDLYSLATSQARVPADYPGIFELIIDGQSVLLDETSRIAGDKSENDGTTEHLTFSFAHPVPVDEETGEETGPAEPLAGPGKHTVTVRFTSRTIEYQNLWVWGASEVPAGVTINAPELKGLQIVG